MATTIDTLQIEIQSSSTNASQGIDALAKSLGELKKNGTVSVAIKNLNTLSTALKNFTDASNATRSLGKLVGSLMQLKEVGSVSKVGNSLTKLSTSLKALEKVNVNNVGPQIERIADAVIPLSSIKAGGLSSMVNAMAKIGKVTADLDDTKINAFAERIQKLNTVLEPLSTKMTTIQQGLRGINTSARSAGSGVKQMGEDVDGAKINLAGFIYIVQEAVQWIQAVAQKFSEFIGAAVEWDGIAARFGRGFGSQAQETYEWIQRLNEEMGINVQQFMQYSSIYATMLTGFGVAHEDATKMALGYTELTYDIWAGYNDVYKSFEEASEAVKSAIAGEVEPIRRAGFTIVESTLEQTAANHGLNISIEKASEAQKSYLRYLTLVDQAHAQSLVGTYAKELQTAEGLMRTFSQQLKSLAQAFGSLFLPILVRVMPYLQAFVELLTEAVHWVAGVFGIEIQAVDWSGYGEGSTAIDQVADSATGATDALDSAAEAAKALKNATIGIDELNVISPTSSSGSDGAGGSGGAGGGNGFDDLDVDSLWDESIFNGIQDQIGDIKKKFEEWMPVLGTIAGALAGLSIASLLKNVGDALEKMNLLQKAAASIAILTVEAALVFAFADNYLESGNMLNLIGEALVTATSGYLMFKTWGVGGATLALGVSILAQLIALKASLADGTVDLSSPETWIQGITTILTGAFGGMVLSKHTGFFAKEGFMIGFGLTAMLTLAAIRTGALESGEIGTDSVENWILEIGSVLSAGLAGKWLGSALYSKGGPMGALIGVTAGLLLNLVGTIEAKGSDFGNEISDWISAAITTATTAFTAAKLWSLISGTVVPAIKSLVSTYVVPALTTALGTIASALGVSVGWAVAIVAAIVAAIAGAIYVATHWEEVKNFFTVTIPEWFSQTGKVLKEFFTQAVPDWFSGAWEAIQTFFTDTIPNFFTETIPGWAKQVGYGIGYVLGTVVKAIGEWWTDDATPFFTTTVPEFFTETIPKAFDDAWTAVVDFFSTTVPDFFKGVWADAKTFFGTTVPSFFTETVPEWFSDAWAIVVDFFTVTVPDFFSDTVEDLKEIGKNLIEGIGDGIKGAWTWFWEVCASFISGLVDGFKDALGIASPSTVFAEIGEFLIQGLWQGISGLVSWIHSNLKTFVSNAISKVKEFFGISGTSSSTFLEIGKFLIQGLWDGINDSLTWLYEKIKSFATGVINKVKEFFGIQSPSKVFAEIGGFLLDGLVNGFSNMDALTEPLKEMWTKVQEWWEGLDIDMSFTPSVGSISDKLSTSWTAAKKWWDEKKEALKTYVAPLGSIEAKLSSLWTSAKKWWEEKKEAMKSYTPSIGSIFEPLYARWNNAKKWWDEKKTALKSYTPSIGSIFEPLYTRWNNAKEWWDEKKAKLKSYTPSIGSIFEPLYTRWTNAKKWWDEKKAKLSSVTPSIGDITKGLQDAWKSAKKWWNSNVKLSIPSLNFKVTYSEPNWIQKPIVKALGLDGWPKLSFAAQGGMFDMGSLIWAGERGAEVVANAGGGKTGVMNVQQMSDAVYEGVYAAVMAANRASQGENGGQAINVYLDGKQITAAVEKRQRERGANIMGNQVYNYG